MTEQIMEKIKDVITAVTPAKEYMGQLQIGFKLERGWFNVIGKEGDLKILLDNFVKKGNEIEFDYEPKTRHVSNIKVTKEEESGSWADEMTNFGDLLTSAHEKGLISINTEMIQIDPEKKFAIFKAVIKGLMDKKISESKGEFTGYGDAEGITNATIKPHWIRMAETRSIVRALRFYTNNAAVAEEETTN